jgi:hypothetical protein
VAAIETACWDIVRRQSHGTATLQPDRGSLPPRTPLLRQRLGDLDGAYALHADLLPLINLLMQAIEPLNRLEKIILKRRGLSW